MKKNTSRLAKFAKVSLGVVACAAVTITAYAAITFDPLTGTGFVGKGDVQLVYNLNNNQLQSIAGSIQFRSNSETTTEVNWVCTNDESPSGQDQIQERSRTTTNSISGVVTTVARERNQFTGFNLNGYVKDANGNPSVVIVEGNTEGPKVDSCPNKWTLTTPAGDPEVVSNKTGLEVSKDGVTWLAIPKI